MFPTPSHRSKLANPGPIMAAWLETVRVYADYDQVNNGKPAYGDWGQHDGTLFLATADAARAQRCADKILRAFTTATLVDRNVTRELTISLALHYDWINASITPAQDVAFRDLLRLIANLIFDRVPSKPWGTRIGDSDEVVGNYFGLRMIAKVLNDPSILDLAPGPQGVTPAAMRSDIARYCVYARGGEWVESDEYNDGTLMLLGFGAHAVGIEEFPEVAATLGEVVEQLWWDYTPDYTQSVEWGDDETPRAQSLSHRVALLSMLCGLGHDPHGKARNLLHILTLGRDPGQYWMDLYRALWVFDPDSPVQPSPPVAYGFRDTPVGLSIHRGPDYLFAVFAPVPLGVDHPQSQPNVQLWYRGEWVLDSVRGYMVSPSGNNAALLYGVGGGQLERFERVSATGDANGCEVVWKCGGRFYNWMGSFPRPPEFVHEYVRTIRFDAASKRITITDVFDGTAELLNPEAYYENDRLALQAALAPWQVLWHCPRTPTAIAGGVEWVTDSGNRVQVVGNGDMSIVPTAGNTIGYINASELTGYTIRFLSREAKADITTTFDLVGVAPVPPPQPPTPPVPPAPPVPPSPAPAIEWPLVYGSYHVFADRIEKTEIVATR